MDLERIRLGADAEHRHQAVEPAVQVDERRRQDHPPRGGDRHPEAREISEHRPEALSAEHRDDPAAIRREREQRPVLADHGERAVRVANAREERERIGRDPVRARGARYCCWQLIHDPPGRR